MASLYIRQELHIHREFNIHSIYIYIHIFLPTYIEKKCGLLQWLPVVPYTKKTLHVSPSSRLRDGMLITGPGWWQEVLTFQSKTSVENSRCDVKFHELETLETRVSKAKRLNKMGGTFLFCWFSRLWEVSWHEILGELNSGICHHLFFNLNFQGPGDQIPRWLRQMRWSFFVQKNGLEDLAGMGGMGGKVRDRFVAVEACYALNNFRLGSGFHRWNRDGWTARSTKDQVRLHFFFSRFATRPPPPPSCSIVRLFPNASAPKSTVWNFWRSSG